jgi:hypothetical protein
VTRRLLDRLVVIVVDETEATVASPYAALGCIKALPRDERRWDADRGLWVVAPEAIDRLVQGLCVFGFECDIWRGGEYVTRKPLSTRSRYGGAA